jgi:hypothetical protein
MRDGNATCAVYKARSTRIGMSAIIRAAAASALAIACTPELSVCLQLPMTSDRAVQ